MPRLIVTTLYLLSVLIPLTFSQISYELFEFPKFILLLSSTLIITLAWSIHLYQTKQSPLPIVHRPSLITLGVLTVLATQALATIFSINPYTSFWGYYSRFHGGLLTTICYTIIYFAALNWLDKESTQKFIKISIKTSFVIGIIAILEHYNISLTCLMMSSLAHLQNAANPLIISTNCWGSMTNPLSRSFATLGQPNWLAAYLIPHIFLTMYLDQTQKAKTLIPNSYFLFSALFVSLLFTHSRSGLLAFGLSYLAYWLLLIRQFSFAKIRGSFIRYSILILLVLAFVGSPFTPTLLSTINHQPSTIVSTPAGTSLETGGTESGDIRKIVWGGALHLIARHPLIGTGPETFAYTYYWVRPASHNLTSEWDYLYNKAHNEYLNLAATTGLIGLLAYLAWHLAIAKASLTRIPRSKKVRQDDDDLVRHFYPVLGASLVGFAITNFFGFSVIPVYLLMTLLCTLPSTLARDPSLPTTPRLSPIAYCLFPILLIYPASLYLADYYFAQGKSYLDANHPEPAISNLQKALRLRPSLDLYHSYLGEAYSLLSASTKSTDYAKLAQQQAEITRQLNPYHLNYYKARAKIYLALASLDPAWNIQAAKELELARQLAPTDPKLAYNLGLVYTRTNQLDKAEIELRETIRLRPSYAEPYYALTLLYEQSKQTEKIPPILEGAKSNLATYSAQLKDKMDKYSE